MTGRVPFYRISRGLGVISAVLKGACPVQEDYPEVAPVIWEVLEPCWHEDPDMRPDMVSLREALERARAPATVMHSGVAP